MLTHHHLLAGEGGAANSSLRSSTCLSVLAPVWLRCCLWKSLFYPSYLPSSTLPILTSRLKSYILHKRSNYTPVKACQEQQAGGGRNSSALATSVGERDFFSHFSQFVWASRPESVDLHGCHFSQRALGSGPALAQTVSVTSFSQNSRTCFLSSFFFH